MIALIFHFSVVFKTAKITFDKDILFDVKEFDGFYVCCDVTHFDECDVNNAWQTVSS